MIQSRRIRWVDHIAVGISSHRWVDNIKMDLEEVGLGVLTGLVWLRIGASGELL
jgi:hypothetical protein